MLEECDKVKAKYKRYILFNFKLLDNKPSYMSFLGIFTQSFCYIGPVLFPEMEHLPKTGSQTFCRLTNAGLIYLHHYFYIDIAHKRFDISKISSLSMVFYRRNVLQQKFKHPPNNAPNNSTWILIVGEV